MNNRRILLEEINRIHEIMGIPKKRLILENRWDSLVSFTDEIIPSFVKTYDEVTGALKKVIVPGRGTALDESEFNELQRIMKSSNADDWVNGPPKIMDEIYYLIKSSYNPNKPGVVDTIYEDLIGELCRRSDVSEAELLDALNTLAKRNNTSLTGQLALMGIDNPFFTKTLGAKLSDRLVNSKKLGTAFDDINPKTSRIKPKPKVNVDASAFNFKDTFGKLALSENGIKASLFGLGFILTEIGGIDWESLDSETQTIVTSLLLFIFFKKWKKPISGVPSKFENIEVVKSFISKVAKGEKLDFQEVNFLKFLCNDPVMVKLIKESTSSLESVSQFTKFYKDLYISKFGQESYEKILNDLLNNTIDKVKYKQFLSSAIENTSKLPHYIAASGIKFGKSEIEEMETLTKKLYDIFQDESKVLTPGKYEYVGNIKLWRNNELIDTPIYYGNFPDESGIAWAYGRSKPHHIVFNSKYNTGRAENLIFNTFAHEAAHIKDPSMISSKLNKDYDEIVETLNLDRKLYENAKNMRHLYNTDEEFYAALNKLYDDFNRSYINYYGHHQETMAVTSELVNNMTRHVQDELSKKPLEWVLVELDDVTRELAQGDLSSKTLEYLGPSWNIKVKDLIDQKPELKPDILKRIYSQIEYLKSEAKLGQFGKYEQYKDGFKKIPIYKPNQ